MTTTEPTIEQPTSAEVTTTEPQLAILKFCCYVCRRTLTRRQHFRSHLLLHQISLKAPPQGRMHLDDEQYTFVTQMNNISRHSIQARYACPSCPGHFSSLTELKIHIENTEHSQPSPPNSSADTQENEQTRPDKRQRASTSASVQIATSNKGIVTFSATSYSYDANLPKFPQQVLDMLQPIVSINTSYTQQSTLEAIKTLSSVHTLLLGALDQSLEDLPRWLWMQTRDERMTTQETKLWNTARFVLTSFASDCSSTIATPSSKDYERSWWVRRVVPIFQAFGNQTDLLAFDWCECETRHFALSEMDPALWQKGRPRYADGLGYDWSGEERLIMEASGGQHKERIPKTMDDSVKQVSSMMAMLRGIANAYPNASFNTLQQTKIIAIQSIRTCLVLSEIQFDNRKKFTNRQVRTAQVPTNFDQRNNWLRIFELLALLLKSLEQQVANLKSLHDEETGKVEVLGPDMTRNCL